jgi:hypothetical protein
MRSCASTAWTSCSDLILVEAYVLLGSDPTHEQDHRVRSPIVPRRILSLALVVLVVVHLLPVPGDPARVVAGFLPWDLAWHLGWILAASLVVIYMTGPPWPDEPPPARQPPPSPTASEERDA